MKFKTSFSVKIIIIVSTVLVNSVLSYLNYQKSTIDSDIKLFNVGYLWTSPTLIADYNFAVYKPQIQYRAEVQNARDSVSPVFILDSYSNKNIEERVSHLIEYLKNNDETNLSVFASNARIAKFYEQHEFTQSAEIRKINTHLLPFIKQVYKKGYSDQFIDRFKLNDIFTIRMHPNYEYSVEKALIYDRQKLSIGLQQFCSDLFNEITAPFMIEVFYKILQPNLIYSDELTNRAATIAEQSVRKTLGIVRKGETIVERGERLTEQKINILKSYNTANIAKEDGKPILKLLGNVGHSIVLYSIVIMFIFTLRKKIWENNVHLLILSSTIILVSALGWLTFQIQTFNPDAPLEYLILIPALSMFVAIVFDSRTAFYVTVSMAMVLAGIRGNDYFIGLSMLFAGSIAAYSVRDIEDRMQIFYSIIFIFIGFALSILVIGLERGNSFASMMPQLFLALINAITAPVVTFCLLLLFNKYSKVIVTNIKLQEYIKKEHPLITELREKAQGTFEHSRGIAQLAAVVAKSINANSLLVQVGALFHEIGKMDNPITFTENKEQYKVDTHTDLTPQQSSKRIISHVINGIEKAKQHNLPQTIIDFIPPRTLHYVITSISNGEQTKTKSSKKRLVSSS